MSLPLTREEQYWVWLSGVEGVTARRFYEMIGRAGSAEEVFRAPPSMFDGLLGMVAMRNFQRAKTPENFDRAIAKLEKSGITAIPRGHELYPEPLSEIYDPPPVLYAKGDPRLPDDRVIAVVGSRKCTTYGEDAAVMLCEELARAGVTIVSGLARGIDAMAHIGCLRGGGRAIAVLANGPDIVYPPEHVKLYKDILASGGAIISEYPPGRGPQKHYFPARNRIMSGMARAVLLVEAAQGSGAMHTVEFAAEQGRDLFIVPGPITSAQSSMPNKLMRSGGKPVMDASDILDEFDWGPPPQPKSAEESLQGFDPAELMILACLGDESFTPTELSVRLGSPVSAINTALTSLEMRGIIRRSAGNLIRKAR